MKLDHNASIESDGCILSWLKAKRLVVYFEGKRSCVVDWIDKVDRSLIWHISGNDRIGWQGIGWWHVVYYAWLINRIGTIGIVWEDH